ncbi:CHAT domain-containing protein [Acrocarpospora sp. B8E8]|uniref:CHAT domain-containing tetratricopeptide repeat protein n=1 Tax=Acrocarpospora sp. B8E8 TaxID=3153572 RepID=UPI00325D30EB
MPGSEHLLLAQEAVKAGNHREAFDILLEGHRQVSARLDAGDAGALTGYVELSIVLSRFLYTEDALKVLSAGLARAHRAGSTELELALARALFYQHAEEADWQTALHYASTFPALAAAWRDGSGTDPDLTETTDVLLTVASEAYQHAAYDVSSALAGIAVVLASDRADAWRMLGWARLRQDDGEAAIKAFAKALELDPSRVGLYRGLAYAYQMARQPVEALAVMDKVTTSSEAVIADFFTRADLRGSAGDYAGALADLEVVEAMARDAPAAESPQPRRDLPTGPAAVAEYARSMPASDLRDFAMIKRVSMLRELNRATEAEQVARHLIATGDRATAAGASGLLADLLISQQPPRAEEAAEYYSRAIANGLRTSAVYLGRADGYLRTGQVAEALADLEAICEGHETPYAVRAARLLDDFLRHHPDDCDVRVVLGHCLIEARRPAEAVAELSKALAAQPRNWRGLMWRGLARVTVSFGEDEAAQAWNRNLPPERTRAALEDLAAATLAAPAAARSEPRQTLVWLVERLIFLRGTYHELALPRSAVHQLVTRAVPELSEVLRNLAAAALEHRPGVFQSDIDLCLSARALAVKHEFTLVAARIDLLLADNYLRLYELQSALDHIAAVWAALPALGYLPGGAPPVQQKQDTEVLRNGGIAINWDADHMGLSELVTTQIVHDLMIYNAEAVARAGDPDRAVRELGAPINEVTEFVTAGYTDPRPGFHVVSLLRDAGDTEKAKEVLDAITPAAEEAGEVVELANLQATLHLKRKEWADAERILVPVVDAGRSAPGATATPDHLVSVMNLATALMSQRRYQDVLDLLDQYPMQPGTRYRTAYGWHMTRGQCHFWLRNYSAAYDDLVAAIDLADSVRGKLRDQELRISWQAELARLYELAFQSAVLSFKFSERFHLMERSRARAFVDDLGMRGTDTPAVRELAEAVERCRSRRRLLRRLLANPDVPDRVEIARQLEDLDGSRQPRKRQADLTAASPAEILARLTGEGRSLKRLEQDLERERQTAWDSVAGSAFTYDEIREFLMAAGRPDGSPGGRRNRILLAEYYLTSDLLTLFMVGVDIPGPVPRLIVFPREEVLRFTRSAFGTDTSVEPGVHPVFDQAEFQSLFRPFVAPIAEHSEPGDLLWIVPHDFLHYVPLHAVEIDGQPLIARNPVVYTPSASVLPPCHARAAARHRLWGTAAVLGDSRGDLPHARDEARAVAELFGAEAHVGRAATGRRLRDLIAGAPDVVHLACHGRYDAADVFQSGVLLAAGPAAPDALEQLTVEELLGLRIDSGLVTLSACESGVSELRPGDELIGLTRALLHAGAPSVLVSLWPVSDLSTSFLMREFYRLVREAAPGSPARLARALAGAQLYLMSLTAEQAIGLCNERLATATEPVGKLTIELERAGVQIAAGDLSEAIACYRSAAQSLRQVPGPLARSLLREVLEKLPLLELKATGAGNADYSRRPFAHPYFWAPFTLVGDWQ